MFTRNFVVILVAMPLAMTSAPVLVFIGGLLGERLAPSEGYATLPVALVVIGTASGAIPAARVMRAYGRRRGFLSAQAIAVLAAILGMFATLTLSFFLLLAAAFCFGFAISFIQQARFAAIENAQDPSQAPKILSAVMLTGVIGGFLGPELALASKDVFAQEFIGSFFAIACLQILAFIVLWQYRDLPRPMQKANIVPARHLRAMLSSPPVVLAVLAGAVGFGVMSFVMTATPNSMHHLHYHDLAATKWVIQLHIAAMFLPSIFSGLLISRFGTTAVICGGILLYALTIALGLSGVGLYHFLFALLALGIGWNFLFIASTMLLSQSYQKNEQFTLQAANDFLIFSVQALASMAAGWVLYQFGWRWVLWLNIPALLLLMLVLTWKIIASRSKSAKHV